MRNKLYIIQPAHIITQCIRKRAFIKTLPLGQLDFFVFAVCWVLLMRSNFVVNMLTTTVNLQISLVEH